MENQKPNFHKNKMGGGGRGVSSFILQTVFVNDADTLKTWQSKGKREEKRARKWNPMKP